MATVGGNLCNALLAGPMISLCAALEGVCAIWTPGGAERRTSRFDFVEVPDRPAPGPWGTVAAHRPAREALTRRTAFRQISLTRLGRSGALLIWFADGDRRFVLTVTAATRRPVRVAFVPVRVAVENADSAITRLAAEPAPSPMPSRAPASITIALGAQVRVTIEGAPDAATLSSVMGALTARGGWR